MNSKRNFIYNFFLLSFFFIGCSNSTIEDEPEMPPFNNETPSNSLCVAQFNIRYDTPEDGQYVWANRKTMAKEIITSHDFDIFGVNECLLNQLNDLLELKQYEYIGTGRDDGKEAGEFCPILYKKERVELLYHGQFWYSETPDKPSKSWNSFCNRICTWGKFKDKKTDKDFFFFSSHFDHVSNEARVNSAKLLVQKVQEIAGDLPYFCTGDLNCDPDEEPISFILNSRLFKDSYSISETTPKGPAGTLHYWNFDFNPEHRIDYILVEKSIKVLSFETITDDARQGRFSSDHYPIMIKAEL